MANFRHCQATFGPNDFVRVRTDAVVKLYFMTASQFSEFRNRRVGRAKCLVIDRKQMDAKPPQVGTWDVVLVPPDGAVAHADFEIISER